MSIYIPPSFREDDPQQARALIVAYPFATLFLPGASVSHLPLLATDGEPLRLRGHFARANPHWRELSTSPDILAVFHGPHGYISPNWYLEHPSVPTWNYAVVHVHGRARVIEQASELRSLVADMVAKFEPDTNAWWHALPDSYLERMLANIVGFEIEVDLVEAKFKLSQNRDAKDRVQVISRLRASGDSGLIELAELMSR